MMHIYQYDLTYELVISSLLSEVLYGQDGIAPRSVDISLAKEKENKAAQEEMKAAEKFVKANDYTGAVAAYSEIYTKYKNFAAGYNQAILTEVTEGTAAAIALLETLYLETNNSMAQKALSDIQKRNNANQAATDQLLP